MNIFGKSVECGLNCGAIEEGTSQRQGYDRDFIVMSCKTNNILYNILIMS